MSYLFQTPRLGFRTYSEEDLPLLVQMNSDPSVMRYFPKSPSPLETESFMNRMNSFYMEKKYCYFAVDRLDTEEFIGFIGLMDQHFEAPFTPCTDIGWRLLKEQWHQGFATEGALASLRYGFEECGLSTIYSVAPKKNTPSLAVMQKIGMKKVDEFVHPALVDYPLLRICEYYKLEKADFR